MACAESGCDSPAAAKGMCRQHYQRDYQHRARGDAQFAPRPRFDRALPCLVEGCGRLNVTLGMCRLHYSRYNKYGSPLVVNKRGIKPKAVDLPDEKSPSRLARLLGVSRQRAHQLLNKDAHNARQSVARALRLGQLVKPSVCERCQRKTRDLEAHHWDYREELDVRWLCPPCHSVIHPHHPTIRAEKEFLTP